MFEIIKEGQDEDMEKRQMGGDTGGLEQECQLESEEGGKG